MHTMFGDKILVKLCHLDGSISQEHHQQKMKMGQRSSTRTRIFSGDLVYQGFNFSVATLVMCDYLLIRASCPSANWLF